MTALHKCTMQGARQSCCGAFVLQCHLDCKWENWLALSMSLYLCVPPRISVQPQTRLAWHTVCVVLYAFYCIWGLYYWRPFIVGNQWGSVTYLDLNSLACFPGLRSLNVSLMSEILISSSTGLGLDSTMPGDTSCSKSSRRLGFALTSNRIGFRSSVTRISKPKICNKENLKN